mmetsp:Transcript_21922/g.65577  ORF Transcript_21922/g.65577 Transcript_21922/m.65577 type:complete len:280 (-) Transcript_21922:291-1130(-)
MHGPQAWTTRRIDATGHGGGGASRKPLPPPGDGGGTPSPRVGAACDISPPGLCAFLLILTCIVSPSLSLRSSPRAYKHPMSEIAAAAGGAAADDDAVPARGGVPPPWAKSSAVARSRSTCFSCRSSASLKSNESERSAKPMPRNAWLPDAASSTRTTKLRDESTDGSMYCRRVPYGTGHSANSSPDAVSTKRTWHVSPRATMRSWPTKILSLSRQSPLTWPVGWRGGMRKRHTLAATWSVCSISSSPASALAAAMSPRAPPLGLPPPRAARPRRVGSSS